MFKTPTRGKEIPHCDRLTKVLKTFQSRLGKQAGEILKSDSPPQCLSTSVETDEKIDARLLFERLGSMVGEGSPPIDCPDGRCKDFARFEASNYHEAD